MDPQHVHVRVQALDTTDQCAPRFKTPRSLPTSVSPISNPTRPWQSAPGQIKPKEYIRRIRIKSELKNHRMSAATLTGILC